LLPKRFFVSAYIVGRSCKNLGMKEAREAAIQSLLVRARRAAGGGAALAAALHAVGIGPESGTYSESAVSNWIKGRTCPPADVLVGAATIFGLSLDAAFGLPTLAAEDHPDGISDLTQSVARLEHLVRSHLGGEILHDEGPSTKDLRQVFTTSAELRAATSPLQLLASSERVDVMGLSLTEIFQEISEVTVAELIENGLTLRCLLLDPGGCWVKAREVEEGHPAGRLADATRTSLLAAARVRSRLTVEASERFQVRVHDHPVRFSITTCDRDRSLVRLCMPPSHDETTPAFLIQSDKSEPHGLFPVFDRVLTSTWESARSVAEC
jgi:hypothetical protein